MLSDDDNKVIDASIWAGIKAFAHKRLPVFFAEAFDVYDKQYQVVNRLAALERRIAAAEKSMPSYGGIWRQGDCHKTGTMVTDRGSLWYCWEETTQRPGTTDSWQLCVKSADSQKVR